MIDDSGFDDVLAFSLKSERYVKAQFLFPDMHVRLASTLKKLNSQTARPDFIIADREDNLQLWSGDLWLVGDVNNNIHLYACTNAAREWCEAQGLELSAPASFEYSGRNIPSTSSVTRDGGAAVLPEGSAVYTNYFALYSSGGFTFTLRGTGLEQLSIALTSDKKANSIDYEIVSSDDGEMVLKFNAAAAKTENVQLKLTNRSRVSGYGHIGEAYQGFRGAADNSSGDYRCLSGGTPCRSLKKQSLCSPRAPSAWDSLL